MNWLRRLLGLDIEPARCKACEAKAWVIERLEREIREGLDRSREREDALVGRNNALMEIIRGQVKQLAELSGVRQTLRAVDAPERDRPRPAEVFVAPGMQGNVNVPTAVRLSDALHGAHAADAAAYMERMAQPVTSKKPPLDAGTSGEPSQ